MYYNRNRFFMTYFPIELFPLFAILWVKPVSFHLLATNFKRVSEENTKEIKTKSQSVNNKLKEALNNLYL